MSAGQQRHRRRTAAAVAVGTARRSHGPVRQKQARHTHWPWQRRPSQRSLTLAAITLLLGSPAVIVPGGLDRFVFGKLACACVGIALSFLVLRAGRLERASRLLLCAACAALLTAALASGSPISALAGRAQRYEGALVLAAYVLAGVAGARLSFADHSRAEPAFKVMTAVCCALALFAVLEAAGLRPLSSDLARPGGLLGNASDEGAVGVLYAGPLLVRSLRRDTWWPWVGTATGAATVVLCASRAALGGLLVALLLIAASTSRRSRRAVGGLVLAVVAALAATPAARARVLGMTPLAGHTVSGRIQLWAETLRMLSHHWWLGVGPSQFESSITAWHDRRWQSSIGPANPPESPHNWVLQAWAAGGVLLLLPVLALAFTLVRMARARMGAGEPWPLACGAGLAGYAATLLATPTSPGTTVPAAVLAGSVLATAPAAARVVGASARAGASARVRTTGRSGRHGPHAALILAGLLAVVFVCASISELATRRATLEVAAGQLRAANGTFATAHRLRPWDVDLAAQALHSFATTASVTRSPLAIEYGFTWLRRCRSLSDDEQVVEDRATLLEADGAYPAAMAVVDAQLKVDRFNPLLLLRRGVLYGEERNFPRAVRDFRSAASISPGSPEPWLDLAVAYRQTGQTALELAADAQARRRENEK